MPIGIERAPEETVPVAGLGPLAPGLFGKLQPSSAATGVAIYPSSVTLTWSASSGATLYDYCVDTTNDQSCTGEAWVVVGNATSASVWGLQPNTTYYWQVRSSTSPTVTGTDADGGLWWRFTADSASLCLRPNLSCQRRPERVHRQRPPKLAGRSQRHPPTSSDKKTLGGAARMPRTLSAD